MESRQHQNKRNGSYKPRQPQEKNKTFTELAEEVKKQFFYGNFNELLIMSKTSRLDNVLETIERFVSEEGKNLSTSQLRNIYDKAKKAKTTPELKLIRPNLAYIAGRNNNDRAQRFLAFIDLLIKSVDSEEKVKEFHTFFEAVVAYHKFYGSKDK